MTNVVNKGANRAAHNARVNRHAQRTPLPPRAGAVEAAREAIDEARVIVDSATEIAEDPKSAAKAAGFAERAAASGWSSSIAPAAGAVELTATRGAETIVQAWLSGVWQYDASVYAFADRVTKPRNASGAAKLLERSPDDAAKELAKVISNKSFRKRPPADLSPVVLPLDPDLLTDEEATKFFKGQTVRWFNRIASTTDTAMVSRTSPVHVTRWDGETIVNFLCPVTGFRSFRLSSVLAVGRGRKAETPETASVELEEAA